MASVIVGRQLPSSHHYGASNTSDDDVDDIRRASKEELFRTAALLVNDSVAGSKFFDADIEDKVPRFGLCELQLGRILGRGGFCVVTEIEKVKIYGKKSSSGNSIGSNAFVSLFRKSNVNELDAVDSLSNPGSVHSSLNSSKPAPVGGSSRAPMSRMSIAHLARKKDRKGGRFALKQVNPDMRHSRRQNISFLKGIVDLAMEAKFLSSLDHPNIISLCGYSKHGPSDFIIVERLKGTLSARFKDWMKIDRQCKGVTGVFTGSKKKEAALYESRIGVAHDIASAAQYLHSQNIIFRDLKPDNIGFDVSGALKIFDFGLAKELRETDRNEDGLYNLTGMTGAMRYMAPEVGLGKPYNLTADVYSWSMIMWFILALEPPFGLYTEDMIRDRVFHRGSRPRVFESWSEPLGDAMKRAWDVDISKRPSFSEIIVILKMEMLDLDAMTTTSSEALND